MLQVIAACLIVGRIVKGPTSLDRMVAVDLMTSILLGAFAVLAAVTRRSDLLAVFIVLSLVGFVGSTTLARFLGPLDPEARRILSREEERQLDEETARRADDAAPVHDVDHEEDMPTQYPPHYSMPQEEIPQEAYAQRSRYVLPRVLGNTSPELGGERP
ncbi:monovalent cation/H+ antiporter complex subunit F [Trueperella sp. LYQ143]|uniref:monovalent cation/H+ antiporter complex subunit F n=1 Tax=Trueperella sp. LYQ143 TaxID=3391059 RepID=UPI0039832044